MFESKLDVYNEACYTVNDALVHLCTFQIPKSTLRSWSIGQSNFEPLIKIAKKTPPLLSFTNLVELYVLAAFRRKYHIPMQNVRRVIDSLSEKYETKHPLATKKFVTDGFNILFQESGLWINANLIGQIAFKFMTRYLKRVEHFDEDVQMKLYPFTIVPESETQELESPKVVSINPNICFGRPVLERIGVPVEELAGRFWAGDSIEMLKRDYDISNQEFEEVIRVGSIIKQAA